MEHSSERVPFLDTLVEIQHEKLETQLYTKPTDAHLYLRPDSCHPYHIFKSIPYSQSLRIRRICSNEQNADKHLNNLSNQLQLRGYRSNTVDAAIDKAKQISRSDLLTYKVSDRKSDRVPLVLTYDSRFAQTSQIINKHMHLLYQSERMKHVFKEPPLVSFRRSRNLQDLLVSSKLKNPVDHEEETPGFTKCPSAKCSLRNFIKEGQKFTSTVTHQSFTINSHIHDKMSWIIYLITCRKCAQQYVGKTKTTLYIRFNNHKSDIKLHNTSKSKNLPIGRHFSSPGHSVNDISIMGIEQIHKQSDEVILRRERYWILKLQTLHPKGINVDC